MIHKLISRHFLKKNIQGRSYYEALIDQSEMDLRKEIAMYAAQFKINYFYEATKNVNKLLF